MARIIDSSTDNTLVVSDIEIAEVKVQVVDCRTNEYLAQSLVSKIEVSNGELTYTAEFKREFESDDKKATKIEEGEGKIKESMQVLQRLGYETANTKTAVDKLPKNYNETWRGYYNTYWENRIPSFSPLTEGDPDDQMINHMIKEYNSHRATDSNGVLKIRIPHLFLDYKKVTVTVGLFNFPVALEGLTESSDAVRRTILSNKSETEFDIRWNNANTQSTDWKGDFGWRIHKGNKISNFKVSEEFTVKDNTDKFGGFAPEEVSSFHGENEDLSENHFFLFALQWCQPIYDFIDDPDPDATQPKRSSAEGVFVNKKITVSTGVEKWARGLHMHIPTKDGIVSGSGAYYGRRAASGSGGDAIKPRGGSHNGIDLYSGPTGDYPVFAVHAGKLTKMNSAGGYGYAGALMLQDTSHPSFYYAHLGETVTSKDWVMTGQKIGKSNITRKASDTKILTYFAEPYHLHFEFFKKAPTDTGVPSTEDVHPRSKIEDFITMGNVAKAKYNKPIAGDANSFIFTVMNELPFMLPCKSVSRTSSQPLKNSETDSDFQEFYDCKLRKESGGKDFCYAISNFPYSNNKVMPSINIKSTDIHSSDEPVRYICPYILDPTSNKKMQLQLKIKWLATYKNKLPLVFSYLTDEETTFNELFVSEAIDLRVDGSLGNNTKKALRSLVKAYYYCENAELELEERILKETDSKIEDTKIQSIIDKYVSGTTISSDEGYSLIREFYDWFTNDDRFNQMCWNN